MMALEMPPWRRSTRMRGTLEANTALDQTYHLSHLQDQALDD